MALTKISRGLLNTGVSDSSDATAITIDSSENVGIGGTPVSTTSGYDGASLHIQQSGTGSSVGSQVRLTSGSSGHAAGDGSYMAHWGDSNLYIANQENANIIVYTNGSERMRITSTGYVGIGTTSPTKKLSLEGGDFSFNAGTGNLGNYYMVINAGTSNDGGFILQRDNTNQWQIVNGSNDGDLLFYSYSTSSTVLYIDRSTGAVGMGFTGQISGGTLSVYSNADGGVVIGIRS